MNITFLVEPEGRVGLQFPLAKRRGGPAIVLGPEESWEAHLRSTPGLMVKLVGRLPLDEVDRERAVQGLKVEADVAWGAVVAQQPPLHKPSEQMV